MLTFIFALLFAPVCFSATKDDTSSPAYYVRIPHTLQTEFILQTPLQQPCMDNENTPSLSLKQSLKGALQIRKDDLILLLKGEAQTIYFDKQPMFTARPTELCFKARSAATPRQAHSYSYTFSTTQMMAHSEEATFPIVASLYKKLIDFLTLQKHITHFDTCFQIKQGQSLQTQIFFPSDQMAQQQTLYPTGLSTLCIEMINATDDRQFHLPADDSQKCILVLNAFLKASLAKL